MTKIQPDRLDRQFSARCPGLVGLGIHRRDFLVGSDPHMKTRGGQGLKRPLSVASFHPFLRKQCPLRSQMTSNLPVSTHLTLTTLHEELPRAFPHPLLDYLPTPSCMAMASHLLPWRLLWPLLWTPQSLVPMALRRRIIPPGS